MLDPDSGTIIPDPGKSFGSGFATLVTCDVHCTGTQKFFLLFLCLREEDELYEEDVLEEIEVLDGGEAVGDEEDDGEEEDMSDEELVELPGGLDQLEAIAEEYAKREEWLLPFSSHNN